MEVVTLAPNPPPTKFGVSNAKAMSHWRYQSDIKAILKRYQSDESLEIYHQHCART
jgi:hypothetical protein